MVEQVQGVGLPPVGDHAGAATAAAAPAGCGYDPAADAYDAALFLGMSAAQAGRDGRLKPSDRLARADEYAGRAVGLLRQAVDRGFTDARRMAGERALAAVRNRTDFRQLVTDLEAKSNPGPVAPPPREVRR